MELPDDVTAEQFLDAVRQGVRDAMWQMITNATMMPCADFYDTLKEGIKQGIEDSMSYRDQITNAITDGVKEAHRGL